MRKTQFQRCFLRCLRIDVFSAFLLAAGYVSAEAPEPQPPEPPAASAAAPQSSSGSPERLLFPRHWIRGYADFQYAPPHNELDLGRCLSSTGTFGGANAQCAAFARYVFSGYVELHPFGRTELKCLFFFAEPKFFFGNTVPHFSYPQSFTPIAYESLLGAGIELPRNFEFRIVRHSVRWLGRYQNNLGPADIGPNGPYGSYSTVGLRWNFGGYGRPRP
jgi:hypothetical protein